MAEYTIRSVLTRQEMRMTQTTERRPGASAPRVNGPHKRHSFWPAEFYSTAVGKKWVMALTGLGLMGFVFAHMVGNLKFFMGTDEAGNYAIDVYGRSLRTLLYPIMPEEAVLWGLRIGLILMVIFHVHSAMTLTRMNQRSRPVKYQSPRDYIAVSFASRTMRWTGIIIFLYVLFHLGDLTIGVPGIAPEQFIHMSVYQNMYYTFQREWVVAIYVLANIALGIHLFHGAWSMFQSMGLNSPTYNGARKVFAVAFSLLIIVGNCAFPLAVLFGLMDAPV